MTRKQYIRSLSSRLAFRLPGEAVADILDEISQRFDEGAAEGMNEDAICAELGAPSLAAAEFLRECGSAEKGQFMHGAFPAAAGLLLSAVFIWSSSFAAGTLTADIRLLLPVISWLIWIMCEGRNWRKSLYLSAPDRAMTVSALLLTGAAVFCTLLVNEALRSPDSLDFIYMLICTVFIAGAMAAWAVSIVRRGEKYMLTLPVLGAGAAIWSAAVSFDFFSANWISYSADPLERREADHSDLYYIEAGGYLRNFLLLILALSVVCLAWTVIKRDRLSLCTFSLLLGCSGSAADIFSLLRRTDPMDIHIPVISVSPFIFNMISAVFWLGIIIIAGKLEKTRSS